MVNRLANSLQTQRINFRPTRNRMCWDMARTTMTTTSWPIWNGSATLTMWVLLHLPPSLLGNPFHTFNSISNSIVVVFLIERNLRGTFSGTQFTWILPDLVYWRPNTHAYTHVKTCVCVHVSTVHCGHVQFVCPIYSRVRVVKAQNAEKCKTWQQLPNNTNRHENNSNNNSHINNNNSCRSELNQGRFYY